jgi:NADH-ubiquinone oxidoreductase chain 6
MYYNNIYLVKLNDLLQYLEEYMTLLSILAIFSAILVIINKNPILSILFLICLFIVIAIYLILLGLNFIGISYLLVYVGAVSILFLFILMLIDIRLSEIQIESNTSLPLAIIISFSFYITAIQIIPSNYFDSIIGELYFIYNKFSINSLDTIIYYMLAPNWDNYLFELLHISNIGNVLYTNNFIWLILTSIILLLAMIGTIVITVKTEK